jgi:dihydroorotase
MRSAREWILSECGWSPFEGTTLAGTFAAAIVPGSPVWRNGAARGAVAGQRIQFKR